ncbi:MAG TPA: TetR/AcrR family transcriptional regulator [Cellulomonas sp.]
MATDARARMVDGAVRLLASRGVPGTSFSEVVELTGAPRGSIYHHFPGGKDELVAAAVELAADRTRATLEQVRGRPAREVAELFLDRWRLLLTATGCTVGCSVAAVTLDTGSETLTAATAAAFRGWTDQLAELLTLGGVPADRAPALATTLVAGAEGAVVLSRAQRDLAPFEQVVETLLALLPAAG